MMPGKHYIAGDWVESEERFSSQPLKGEAWEFELRTAFPALVQRAAVSAEDGSILFHKKLSRGQVAGLDASRD
jgi:2,5-dioxopentanoate dehydrogenase